MRGVERYTFRALCHCARVFLIFTQHSPRLIAKSKNGPNKFMTSVYMILYLDLYICEYMSFLTSLPTTRLVLAPHAAVPAAAYDAAVAVAAAVAAGQLRILR